MMKQFIKVFHLRVGDSILVLFTSLASKNIIKNQSQMGMTMPHLGQLTSACKCGLCPRVYLTINKLANP